MTTQVKDFRRLKNCPRCSGQTATMKKTGVERTTLYHNTHLFKNWKAYQASVAASQVLQISGGYPKPIDLEIKSMRCVCPVCGFGAYYLADTGEECDRMGRRMGNRRWKKLTGPQFRKMSKP